MAKPAKPKPTKAKKKRTDTGPGAAAGALAAKPKPVKAKPAKAKPAKAKKAPKSVRRAEARVLTPLEVGTADASAAVLDRLWQTVEDRRRAGDVLHSHSARLIARGTPKVAQKLGEEAVECVIEATQGHRQGVVLESADLLYHLMVVWVDAGIRPEEVWAELRRREGVSGIAEKAARPKGILRAAQTTKLP
jgi:phosphoribosyl-ATP pyrophosphohydrolase